MGTEKEKFMLEPVNENRFIRILQVAFGIVCLIVALIWIVLNFSAVTPTTTVWITIIFLSGFGYYQVVSGLGRAVRFIEFGKSGILLKQYSILPARKIPTSEIEKIEIFPLSIIFVLQSGKKAVLRFGTSNTDLIPPVKEGASKFADGNSLKLSYRKEDI